MCTRRSANRRRIRPCKDSGCRGPRRLRGPRRYGRPPSSDMSRSRSRRCTTRSRSACLTGTSPSRSPSRCSCRCPRHRCMSPPFRMARRGSHTTGRRLRRRRPRRERTRRQRTDRCIPCRGSGGRKDTGLPLGSRRCSARRRRTSALAGTRRPCSPPEHTGRDHPFGRSVSEARSRSRRAGHTRGRRVLRDSRSLRRSPRGCDRHSRDPSASRKPREREGTPSDPRRRSRMQRPAARTRSRGTHHRRRPRRRARIPRRPRGEGARAEAPPRRRRARGVASRGFFRLPP